MSALFGAVVGILALALGSGAAGQTQEEPRMSGDSEIAVSRRARTESLETLPRWPTSDEYFRGPRLASSLQTDDRCYSIGEVLQAGVSPSSSSLSPIPYPLAPRSLLTPHARPYLAAL
jgi:hypothetical protein